MGKNILKTSNRICGFILGLLGFSLGCQSCGLQTDAYGSPSADYVITGRVTDANSNPIKNIEVNITREEGGKDYSIGILNTDDKGEFLFEKIREGWGETNYTLKYRDTDGVENGGEFEDMTQGVEFKYEDFTGGDHDWYSGKATKIVNATLTLKDPQEK